MHALSRPGGTGARSLAKISESPVRPRLIQNSGGQSRGKKTSGLGKTRAPKHFDALAQNLSNRTWRISSAFSAKPIRPISAIFVKTRMRLGIRRYCLLEMNDMIDQISGSPYASGDVGAGMPASFHIVNQSGGNVGRETKESFQALPSPARPSDLSSDKGNSGRRV